MTSPSISATDDAPWGDASWPDTIRLGKGGNATPKSRYPHDYDWLRRWTLYAEVMRHAFHIGDLVNGKTNANILDLEEIGSPSRRLYLHLDIDRLGSGTTLARKLIEDIIVPVLTKLY